jgi:hypothetical protein
MKQLIIGVGIVLLFGCESYTGGRSTLARVTVYWPGEGSGEQAAWNGARLREQQCAVDPKKIPYGSEVAFPDNHMSGCRYRTGCSQSQSCARVRAGCG